MIYLNKMLLSVSYLHKYLSFNFLNSRFKSNLITLNSTYSNDVYIPDDFLYNFSLPIKSSKYLLEIQNRHEMDDKIQFDELSHVYYYNTVAISTSVTSLIEHYFEKFEPDKAINLMINSKNWPRSEYQWENGEVYSSEEIKKKWESIGKHSSNYGHWMHFNIERLLNNMSFIDIPEMKKFKAFKRDMIDMEGIIPFRTEWRIAAPQLNLAGSVDFVGVLPNGSYVIMDWKCSKNLPKGLVNKYRKAKFPIDKLDDCAGSKYSLQVNIYRYILENYYNIKISKMIVATFHESIKDDYFYIDVPFLNEEVREIMEDFAYRNLR